MVALRNLALLSVAWEATEWSQTEFHFARVTQVESKLKGEGENMGQSRDSS